MVLAFGLAFVLAYVEDRSDCLLAGGVVRGDVEQVTGGTGLQSAKLVDQGLAGCPGEECTDDVCVDDIRKGVASFREPTPGERERERSSSSDKSHKGEATRKSKGKIARIQVEQIENRLRNHTRTNSEEHRQFSHLSFPSQPLHERRAWERASCR